jgi:hypothetical protein
LSPALHLAAHCPGCTEVMLPIYTQLSEQNGESFAERQPLVCNCGVTGRKAAAPAVHFFLPAMTRSDPEDSAAAVAICSRPKRDFVVTPIDGRHRDDPCSARRVGLSDQAKFQSSDVSARVSSSREIAFAAKRASPFAAGRTSWNSVIANFNKTQSPSISSRRISRSSHCCSATDNSD